MSEVNTFASREEPQKMFVARPSRHQAKLPVQITHQTFMGTRCSQAVCTDLNEHGMGVDIPHSLSVGEIVRFALELPSGRLEAYARVTYRRHFHYGFYFVDLEAEQRERFREAVETMVKRRRPILQ